MKVTVTGLKELDAALGELRFATAKTVLRRAGLKALEIMAERARQLAPDDPRTKRPDLKSSIAVADRIEGKDPRRTRPGDPVVVYMGVTKGGYPQAVMQEFGTAHHPPQPYMRPAFDATRQQVVDSIAGQLAEELEKTRQRVAKRRAKLGKAG